MRRGLLSEPKKRKLHSNHPRVRTLRQQWIGIGGYTITGCSLPHSTQNRLRNSKLGGGREMFGGLLVLRVLV